MGDMRWRQVGYVDELREKSCWRLSCASSSTARGDLVLVYVAKLDKFFCLDGVCSHIGKSIGLSSRISPVVLNLFHCWDPLNATDVVWDPQVKIEKVCAPE